MRPLGFATALLLAITAVLASTATAKTPKSGASVHEGLDSEALWKKYCAGRPLYEHDWPSHKEWPSGLGVDKPYYSGRAGRTAFEATDGYYQTLDGKVSCLVHGDKIACSNGGQTAQCDPKGCRGGGTTFYPDPDVDVTMGFRVPKHPRILPASVSFHTGSRGPLCRTYGNVVRCRKGPPEDAGFSIDAYFIRVESYINVADGWPWDGKCHNPFETD